MIKGPDPLDVHVVPEETLQVKRVAAKVLRPVPSVNVADLVETEEVIKPVSPVTVMGLVIASGRPVREVDPPVDALIL